MVLAACSIGSESCGERALALQVRSKLISTSVGTTRTSLGTSGACTGRPLLGEWLCFQRASDSGRAVTWPGKI